VYLTLPREVLAERLEAFEYSDPARAPRPGPLAPDAGDGGRAARLLASARHPIVITKALGRDPEAVGALVTLAEALALPVIDTPTPSELSSGSSTARRLRLHARARRGPTSSSWRSPTRPGTRT